MITEEQRERRRVYHRLWRRAHYTAHAEECRAYQRAWRETNRERSNGYPRAWKARNIGRVRLDAARRKLIAYTADPGRFRAHSMKWARANPARLANARNRRRVIEASATGSHTEQAWQDKIVEHGGRCCYCGCTKPLGRDHVVPLSRGGSDDIANILPACNGCNSGKRDREVAEFLVWRIKAGKVYPRAQEVIEPESTSRAQDGLGLVKRRDCQ